MLGKSRVVPRKKQTIPRLELTAARIGAKLAACVQRELDLPLDATVMWTDSAIVLGYITNRRKRFQTFVANRVAAIHELTKPDEWRHVDGKLNPADLASRGLHAGNEFDLSTWISGPVLVFARGQVATVKSGSTRPGQRPRSEERRGVAGDVDATRRA